MPHSLCIGTSTPARIPSTPVNEVDQTVIAAGASTTLNTGAETHIQIEAVADTSITLRKGQKGDPLRVEVTGSDIIVHLATDFTGADGAIRNTAREVVDAINGSDEAAAEVEARLESSAQAGG